MAAFMEKEEILVKTDIFIQKRKCVLRLSNTYIHIDQKPKEVCIPLAEVVALHVDERDSSSSSSSRDFSSVATSDDTVRYKLSYVHRYKKYKWRVESVSIRFTAFPDAEEFVRTVRHSLDAKESGRPKRVLVFVNPYGGKRQGPKIYEAKAAPLFRLAGVTAVVVETQYAGHASDVMSTYDLTSVDGVVCVGGDGLLAEIVNSLLKRTQVEAGLDLNDFTFTPAAPPVPIGLVPAGSTNAVAFSIAGTSDPVTNTLHIILGDRVSCDVNVVHGDSRLLSFVLSGLSYGFYGDLLEDSEKKRWMGPFRYDWSGFKKVLQNKAYSGEVSYVPYDEPSTSLRPHSPQPQICMSGCSICSACAQREELPLPPEPEWRRLSGRYLAVNSFNISCRCRYTSLGPAPSQHLGNGGLDVTLVKDCGIFSYVRHLTRLKSGRSQDDLSYVTQMRVKAFRFSVPEHATKHSVWNADGELIRMSHITARSHCQLLPLFARGIEEPRETTARCNLCLAKQQPREPVYARVV